VLFRAARDIRNKVLILLSGGIAIVLANLADGDTLPLSVALATANVAEVATACWLLNRFRDASPDITRVRSLAFFILLAGGAAPLVSATIGTTAVVIDLRVPFSEVWLTWYTANALGMTIVAPFALLINSEQWRELRLEKRIAEAIGILALIAIVAFAASFNRAFFFMVVPVVLIATFRFGVVGAAAGILVIAVVGNICIALGIAPPIFALATIPERILTLQFFLAATAIWALPVAAVLLERDRLVAELTAGKSEAEAATETKSRMVKSLHRHLWNAEERERLRLAHELHDQTGQSLVAAMMELNELRCHVTGDKCDRLCRVREQLDGVGETLRRVAWELRPSSLDDFGLAQALENHLVDWGERCSIEVDFDCSDPDIDRLPDDIRTTIYRVVQESLTNVAKHA
jgi:signal transduction histidine kinase